MPMGTPTDGEPDTEHAPQGPSAGTLMTPAEVERRRLELTAQLAALPTAAPPVAPSLLVSSAPDLLTMAQPEPEPVQPFSAVNMLPSPDDGNPQHTAPPDAVPVTVLPRPVAPNPGPAPVFSNVPPAPAPPAPEPAKGPVVVGSEQDTPDNPFSHWLHLADGRILKAMGTFTRWHDTDDPRDPGVPVVTSIANPNYAYGTGDITQRRRALLAELKALGFDLGDLVGLLK